MSHISGSAGKCHLECLDMSPTLFGKCPFSCRDMSPAGGEQANVTAAFVRGSVFACGGGVVPHAVELGATCGWLRE